jgi:hypothetical protein
LQGFVHIQLRLSLSGSCAPGKSDRLSARYRYRLRERGEY